MSRSDNLPEHWMTRTPLRSSPARRLFAGLLCIAFALPFLYFLLPELAMNLRARSWPTTTCTILQSTVASKESSDTDSGEMLYRAEIYFAYELQGKRYESSRFRFANPYTSGADSAHRMAERYAVGSKVSCYVSPQQPDQAVLDRRISPYHLFTIIPVVFLLLGLWELGAGLAALARRN